MEEEEKFDEEGLNTNLRLKYKRAMKGWTIRKCSNTSRKRTSIYRMGHWNARKEREKSGNEETPTKLRRKWDSYCSNWQNQQV